LPDQAGRAAQESDSSQAEEVKDFDTTVPESGISHDKMSDAEDTHAALMSQGIGSNRDGSTTASAGASDPESTSKQSCTSTDSQQGQDAGEAFMSTDADASASPKKRQLQKKHCCVQ